MDSKFIISVVLATLVRNSFAVNLTLNAKSPYYGSSEEKFVIFSQTQPIPDTLNPFGTFQSLFEVLRRFSVNYLAGCSEYDLAEGITTATNEAVTNEKTFTATLLVIIQWYHGITIPTEAQSSLANAADRVYTSASNVLSEALGTEHDIPMKARIEELHEQSKASATIYVNTLFSLIPTTVDRTCVETTVVSVNEKVIKDYHRVIDAFYNGVKQVRAAIEKQHKDVSLLSGIDHTENDMKIAFDFGVWRLFALLQTDLLAREHNIPSSYPQLYSILFAQISATYNNIKASASFVELVKKYVTNHYMGLNRMTGQDSSVWGTSKAETVSYFKVGLDVLLESVMFIHPDVTDSPDFFTIVASVAGDEYFGTLANVMKDNAVHDEAIAKIAAVRQSAHDGTSLFIPSLLKVLTNDKGSDEDDKYADHISNIIANENIYIDSIFDMLVTLVETILNNGADNRTEQDVLQEIDDYFVLGKTVTHSWCFWLGNASVTALVNAL